MTDDPTPTPEPEAAAAGPQPATGIGSEPVNTGRDQAGRFRKGTTGNRRGKPKGARHKTTMMAETLVAEHAQKVMQRCLMMAVDKSDPTAMRLLVERIYPVPKDRRVHFALVENDAGAIDISGSLTAIARGVATGELTPGEAGELSKLLEATQRLQSINDIESRLAALEAEKTHGRP